MFVSSRESFERASSYSRINYIAGSDRGEVLFLPEALEDYLTPENQVRSLTPLSGSSHPEQKQSLPSPAIGIVSEAIIGSWHAIVNVNTSAESFREGNASDSTEVERIRPNGC